MSVRHICRVFTARSWLEGPRHVGRRQLSIRALSKPSASAVDLIEPSLSLDQVADSPDVQFDILQGPAPILSIKLSASQNLYTRRGSLIGVEGNPENAVSTLSMLSPLIRGPLRIPFMYQKISSISPLTLLIGSKASNATLTTLKLDGTIDWNVVQRDGLLAWSGESLLVAPALNRHLSMNKWGNSRLSGRGLVALVGRGQVHEVSLDAGDDFVIHPSNVLAYTLTKVHPLPYRLSYSTFKFQIPGIQLDKLFSDVKFFRVMAQSDTWKFLTKWGFKFRMWARRSIWGDRLFLRFRGPCSILLQSQASKMTESLVASHLSELAVAEPGALLSTLKSQSQVQADTAPAAPKDLVSPTAYTTAKVVDGKVTFTRST